MFSVSRLQITYGPPEQAEERREEVSTLVKNLRNAETDAEVGPCGNNIKTFEILLRLSLYFIMPFH